MSSNVIIRALKTVGLPIFSPSITVRGEDNLPPSGGFLLAANHVDWLDGFFISTAVLQAQKSPVYFLSTSNYYWWTSVTIQIPDRQASIIDTAVTQLRRGKIICNFPEGARNSNQQLLPGKTGTVRMAVLAGVPVIPLGITCSSHRTMGQSFLNVLARREKVQLSFGVPLTFAAPPEGFSKDWLDQETIRLMKAIAPLCHKTL